MNIEELLKKRFTPNKNFAGAFATIDIIGSSSLEGTPKEISDTKGALRTLIDELIRDLPIARTDWMGDGTLLIADASQGCDDLVVLCDKLVNLLPFFNRARDRCNFLRHDIVHLRIVCHHAPAVFNTGDKEILTDPVVNTLCKYDRNVEIPDHIVITDEVYQGLSPDIKSRLIPLEPDKQLGACYVLDGRQVSATVELDTHETQLMRNWLYSSTKTGKYDQVYIFGYTNESLSEIIVPLPNVMISILARSWLEELQDEVPYNQKYSPGKDELPPTGSLWFRWEKSNTIRSHAETLMNPQSTRPYRNQIDMRFYEGPPWLKGVLLKDSKTGNRTAFIGLYPFLPSKVIGGSPYQREKWSGIWLSDDKTIKNYFLNAVESRFQQLWETGFSFDKLVEKQASHPSTTIPIYEKVWCADEHPYLIIYPAEQQPDRPFPKLLTEDLMACMILEHRLSSIGFGVEFEPMLGSTLPERAASWDGHIVLICLRSWTDTIYEHLRNLNFPFSFEFKDIGLAKKRRVPIIKHVTQNQSYISPIDRLPAIAKDYCIVGKCDRPGKSGKLFLIAGIHGLGTWGGSEFLTNEKHLAYIVTTVKNANFAVLVQSKFLLPHRLEEVRCITSPETF